VVFSTATLQARGGFIGVFTLIITNPLGLVFAIFRVLVWATLHHLVVFLALLTTPIALFPLLRASLLKSNRPNAAIRNCVFIDVFGSAVARVFLSSVGYNV
jgi:hypothetical protein